MICSIKIRTFLCDHQSDLCQTNHNNPLSPLTPMVDLSPREVVFGHVNEEIGDVSPTQRSPLGFLFDVHVHDHFEAAWSVHGAHVQNFD